MMNLRAVRTVISFKRTLSFKYDVGSNQSSNCEIIYGNNEPLCLLHIPAWSPRETVKLQQWTEREPVFLQRVKTKPQRWSIMVQVSKILLLQFEYSTFLWEMVDFKTFLILSTFIWAQFRFNINNNVLSICELAVNRNTYTVYPRLWHSFMNGTGWPHIGVTIRGTRQTRWRKSADP